MCLGSTARQIPRLVGRAYSRAASKPSISIPHQIKHPSFEGPLFHSLNQSFAQRVLLNIKPLLRISFPISQTMVPPTRLKPPFLPAMFAAEFPFPIGDPFFHRAIQISWRTKQVQVIRHQQIIAHMPGCGLQPALMKNVAGNLICQPWFAFQRGDRQKNYIGLFQAKVNA